MYNNCSIWESNYVEHVMSIPLVQGCSASSPWTKSSPWTPSVPQGLENLAGGCGEGSSAWSAWANAMEWGQAWAQYPHPPFLLSSNQAKLLLISMPHSPDTGHSALHLLPPIPTCLDQSQAAPHIQIRTGPLPCLSSRTEGSPQPDQTPTTLALHTGSSPPARSSPGTDLAPHIWPTRKEVWAPLS